MVHTICLEALHDAGESCFVLQDATGITRALTEAQLRAFMLSGQLDCENFALGSTGNLSVIKPIGSGIALKDKLNAVEFCSYMCMNRDKFLSDVEAVSQDKDGEWMYAGLTIGFLSKSIKQSGGDMWTEFHKTYDNRNDGSVWDVYEGFEYSFYREPDDGSADLVEDNPNSDAVFSRAVYHGGEQVDSGLFSAGFSFSKDDFNKMACEYITTYYDELRNGYYPVAEVTFFSDKRFKCTLDEIYAHRNDLLSYLRFKTFTS